MYAHPATRANVARLRDGFGYRIVEPESGALASGQTGVGRLAELPTIVDAVVEAIGDRPVRAPDPAARPPTLDGPPRDADLVGRRVVVTAGGTREPIDPVRYIGNRSTGRMGAAIAAAALDRGATVTLIAANLVVPAPDGATVVTVESTGDLRAALLGTLVAADGRAGFDVLVMAAAVADFRPTRPAETKLARGDGLTLELEPTPDLLAEAARIARGLDTSGAPTREAARPAAGPRRVRRRDGFARACRRQAPAQGRGPAPRQRRRRGRLGVRDRHEPGHPLRRRSGSRTAWPLLSKREVADRLLDRVVELLADRDATPG